MKKNNVLCLAVLCMFFICFSIFNFSYAATQKVNKDNYIPVGSASDDGYADMDEVNNVTNKQNTTNTLNETKTNDVNATKTNATNTTGNTAPTDHAKTGLFIVPVFVSVGIIGLIAIVTTGSKMKKYKF